MNKYVIKFTKQGYIRYTSHLDMLRLFKRTFKKCGIDMAYSQGFNPHPKMGFAQPLSLGYTSSCEYLELETREHYDPKEIMEKIVSHMPEGVEILSCTVFPREMKSLAASAYEAEYSVVFPVANDTEKYTKVLSEYLSQERITAQKRQKKTKRMVEVDIRPKIRNIEVLDGEKLTLLMNLDCGSTSNLSPEQVISSFSEFAGLSAARYDIEIERKSIKFDKILHEKA